MQRFKIEPLKLKMGYLLIYKLFEETDKFKFLIIFNVHFEINIPSTVIYGSIFSEFLCISRCLLKLEHFLPRPSERFSGMLSQQGNQSCLHKQIPAVHKTKHYHQQKPEKEQYGLIHHTVQML